MTDQTTAPLLDVLASYARTALDDPDSLPDGEWQQTTWGGDRGNATGYAIGKLDEIIEALRPSDESRETMADTLTVLGRHLAERADEMEARDAVEPDRAAYVAAAKAVRDALDGLDLAVDTLRDES